METEKLPDFNFLGVILDEFLTWKPHIDKLASKLSWNAGILNKLKDFLSAFIMKTLYFSHSHSHLNYGILIWGYKCNRLMRLEKNTKASYSYRNACKIECAYWSSIQQAAILKISDMLRVDTLKFYYEHQHGKLPNHFWNFDLTTQGSHHSYDTRSSEHIRTDRTRAEFHDNRITLFLPKFINSTPANLLQKITTISFQGFTSSIKRIS